MLQGYLSVLYTIFQCYLVGYGLTREGTRCRSSGVPGVCSLVKNCDKAKQSLEKYDFVGLKRCGFLGDDEVICCPIERPTYGTTTEPTKETTNEPTKQTTNEPTKQTTNEPTKQTTNEPEKRPCKFSGQSGKCERVINCPMAIDYLGKTGTTIGLQNCGFIDGDEIVCCITSRTSTTDVPLSTPSTNSKELESSCDGPEVPCIPVKLCEKAAESLKQNRSVGLKSCGSGPNKFVCCPVNLKAFEVTIPVDRRISEEVCANISQDVGSFVRPYISGGLDAKENEFPHMAALGYEGIGAGDKTDFSCGATLISNRFLLTAAHCSDRTKPDIVRLGVTKLDDPEAQNFPIKNVTLHPDYNTSYNDIALIEINGTINFNKNIYPACLYSGNIPPKDMIITGWGKTTYETGNDRKNTLQKATVYTMSHEDCNRAYENYTKTILTTQICAQADKSDTCQGDSGGPLQKQIEEGPYTVVGVVSFGINSCEGKYPGVYTKVSEYLKWIENIVWPQN